ncbi:MAG TPA: enoyl-CoA hydratase/isomerase family protein [Acetobacteraceae bacterium]|jgi:enoyl-CoA hydratase/carnithine racemase|nr:enoyl-CoA hydratase/isomerase family protein [Acetobacteraceae bacterium]
MTEQSVVARRDGRIGAILMNRPHALNALDLPVIRAITAALAEWRDDPHVHAVVIEGAGDRAFCAGGDIRAIRSHALAGDTEAVEAFFAEEYELNAMIAEYPQPYVALIDGICMGGGIGVSVHGTYRVATEGALFAMPEAAIGMFPDIGATYVLPRLPDSLGVYLGLTGARLAGADAVHAGLATHFVPRESLASLRADLARDGLAAIGRYTSSLPAFSLETNRYAIEQSFGAPSVARILAALEDQGEWGRETLKVLRAVSPAAALWSFGIIRAGADRTLRQCLAAELRLTRQVTRHSDFAEGVRAMVVDKDRHPKWSDARIEDVDPAAIAAMLA